MGLILPDGVKKQREQEKQKAYEDTVEAKKHPEQQIAPELLEKVESLLPEVFEIGTILKSLKEKSGDSEAFVIALFEDENIRDLFHHYMKGLLPHLCHQLVTSDRQQVYATLHQVYKDRAVREVGVGSGGLTYQQAINDLVHVMNQTPVQTPEIKMTSMSLGEKESESSQEETQD